MFFKKKYTPKNPTDFVFVGLGNPGDEYRYTRHNIGWMVLEAFSNKHQANYKQSSKFIFSELEINQKNILLVIPTTYMNRTGQAVKEISNNFDISLDKFLMIVDEYNFPLGKLHLKTQGSSGGHNGIKSVLDEMGSDQFSRLRCGIDKNFEDGNLIEYVLSNFENHEKDALEKTLLNSTLALEHITQKNYDQAMSDINSSKLFTGNN